MTAIIGSGQHLEQRLPRLLPDVAHQIVDQTALLYGGVAA